MIEYAIFRKLEGENNFKSDIRGNSATMDMFVPVLQQYRFKIEENGEIWEVIHFESSKEKIEEVEGIIKFLGYSEPKPIDSFPKCNKVYFVN